MEQSASVFCLNALVFLFHCSRHQETKKGTNPILSAGQCGNDSLLCGYLIVWRAKYFRIFETNGGLRKALECGRRRRINKSPGTCFAGYNKDPPIKEEICPVIADISDTGPKG